MSVKDIREQHIHKNPYGPRPKRNPLMTNISVPDLHLLLKAAEDARPVMERQAIAWCFLCKIGRCSHIQARAWMKEYFPEVKS